jgi:hypothetical protein
MVVNLIFAHMELTCKLIPTQPQRGVVAELLGVLFARRGRATFVNLARFSAYHEQTFRRHFKKAFDWVGFNVAVLRLRVHPRETLVGVFDCTLLPKSGRQTYGLDRFFCTTRRQVQSGLEVTLLGVVAAESRRTTVLDATQTPAGLSVPATKAAASYTRMDFYLEQVTDVLRRLDRQPRAPEVTYWVGDGNYARRKVFDAIRAEGRHLITRLRSDARLRPAYRGPQTAGRGRRRKYGEQIRFDQVGPAGSAASLAGPMDPVGVLPDKPHVEVFTTVAQSPNLKRWLRVVMLRSRSSGDYVLLASTDTEQAAEEVVAYYRLRYQLELRIRDAKQHAGLAHCQARSQEKIDFHVNLSVAAVNLGRWTSQRTGLSLHSLRREAHIRFIANQILMHLGLKAEMLEKDDGLRQALQTGQVVW